MFRWGTPGSPRETKRALHDRILLPKDIRRIHKEIQQMDDAPKMKLTKKASQTLSKMLESAAERVMDTLKEVMEETYYMSNVPTYLEWCMEQTINKLFSKRVNYAKMVGRVALINKYKAKSLYEKMIDATNANPLPKNIEKKTLRKFEKVKVERRLIANLNKYSACKTRNTRVIDWMKYYNLS